MHHHGVCKQWRFVSEDHREVEVEEILQRRLDLVDDHLGNKGNREATFFEDYALRPQISECVYV
jgi:hypothetical protein